MASGLKSRLAALTAWSKTPAGLRVKTIFSAALSVAIFGLLLRTLLGVPPDELQGAIAVGPLSWGLLILSYALQPLIDWQMFRKWWKLGLSDIGAFLRRRVLNEAVVSYAGDAWFGLWAARRLSFVMADEARELTGRGDGPGRGPRGSPLAAVKDVAITSGLAGNLFVLLNLGLMLLLGGTKYLAHAIDPALFERIVGGFVLLLGISIAILVNRNRVFSLATRFNVGTFGLHLLRLLVCQAALLGSWAVAVPGITAGNLAMLGAVRLLVTRLPLPNKEVLFAAMATSLAGPESQGLAALLAVQGAAWLMCHAVSWAIALMLGRAR